MKSFREGKHMFYSKRFALLVAAVALCAAGAVAQTNSYDIPLQNQVTVNNCSAGEPVALNGHVQVSLRQSRWRRRSVVWRCTARTAATAAWVGALTACWASRPPPTAIAWETSSGWRAASARA